MRTKHLQIGGERAVGAEECLHAHGGGDVGRRQQAGGVLDGEQEHAQHPVGAVDEGDALLGLQGDRRQSGRRERRPGVLDRTGRGGDLALADQRERDVSERSQVAAGAE